MLKKLFSLFALSFFNICLSYANNHLELANYASEISKTALLQTKTSSFVCSTENIASSKNELKIHKYYSKNKKYIDVTIYDNKDDYAGNIVISAPNNDILQDNYYFSMTQDFENQVTKKAPLDLGYFYNVFIKNILFKDDNGSKSWQLQSAAIDFANAHHPLINYNFCSLRINSNLPIVSTPAVIKNNYIFIPYIKKPLAEYSFDYYSMVLKKMENTENMYIVDSIREEDIRYQKNVVFPMGNNNENKFFITSAIEKDEALATDHSTGSIFYEYEMQFNMDFSLLHVGDIVSLQKKTNIR